MKPLVIACNILRDEVTMLFERYRLARVYDLVWMEDSLHNDPKQLNEALQDMIDAEQERSFIMLTYGNCGNGLVGISSGETTLVLPHFADCISILLHERSDLDELRKSTIFLTRGWMNGEQSMDVEYQRLLERRGPKRAKKIIDAMYEHYSDLMLIDTGAFDAGELRADVHRIAAEHGLEPERAKGDTGVLERLFLRQWDTGEFLVVEPHTTIGLHDFFDFS